MESEFARYLISVDSDGQPLHPITDRIMSDSEFEDHVRRLLDHAMAFGEEKPNKKILIFIHGGLNKIGSARKKAISDADNILSAGYYPIFIGWRSGFLSTYWEHATRVRQGRITGRLRGRLTAGLYIVADIAGGVAQASPVFIRRAFSFARNQSNQQNVDALYNELALRYAQGQNGGKPAFAISWDRSGVDSPFHAGQSLVLALIKWIPSMLLDGLGSAAWGNMLRRTKTVFRQPAEFDIGSQRSTGQVAAALDSRATGAMSVFLSALGNRVSQPGPNGEREPNWDEYEITVIGHSMGAVIANEMIRQFGHLPFKNIVYMGAACSIRDFVDSVTPFMIKHPEARFYNLCLHPNSEIRELNFFSFSPRGSLLQWIDEFLQEPETTPDRALGKWVNVLQSTHLIPRKLRGRVNLKAFSYRPGGRAGNGDPQKHGHFSQEAYWDQSWW